MPDVRLAVFVLVTAALAYLSRASLVRPRSHGFVRFFVFEAVLGLFLLNALQWFVDPLSWHQVISWVLLMCSLVPLILGVWALQAHGKPNASDRPDPELLGFERTSRLVDEGVFGLIRHPMYCSLLLFAWGVFMKAPALPAAALALGATAGLILMAKRDEDECQRAFGVPYREYMRRTRRFIPYVY
ncbi:MAG TPA: isoprenylcysteine carboxylmethyltransferase family protein [Anaerolineales bacterium]